MFGRLEQLEARTMLSADAAAIDAWSLIAAPTVEAAWFADLNPDAAPQRDAAGSLSTYQTSYAGQAVEATVGSWFVQLSARGLGAVTGVADVADALSLDNLGATVVRGLGLAGLVQITTADWVDAKQFVDALAQNLYVDYVAPDIVIRTAATPNDSRFGAQWALHNTGQTGGVADADIDAPAAWDKTTGSASVIVAVIDSGVDYTHPDLAANMWRNPGEIPGDGIDNDGNGFVDDVFGYDFVQGDGDPMDANGHGTHVAGTIAADANNGIGVSGVSWNSQIMALRFLDAGGSGSATDAVRALNYATMMRTTYGQNVRVTNNSWGGGGYYQPLFAAISASRAADMLFVTAAGNSGTNNDTLASYPANYSLNNILAVAATDHRDRLASFSQYGAASVDLGAPGVSILSTVPGGGYASYSGTSMATPHVAGVAALVWSRDPSATYAQVRDAILTGADPISALTGKTLTGARLNARGALDAIDGNPPHPENLTGGSGSGGGSTTPPSALSDLYEDNDTQQITDSRPAGAVNSPNLGLIIDQRVITGLNTLDDPTDWYRFSTNGVGGINDFVRINFTHAQGDLDIWVYDQFGGYVGSSFSTSNVETVSLAGQAAGVYYVKVEGWLGAANPNYTLTIDAPGSATKLDAVIGHGDERTIRWTDADGTLATLGIRGGVASLHFTGQHLRMASNGKVITISGVGVELDSLRVTESTPATRLGIKASGGNGFVAVRSIVADGVIRSMNLRRVDVNGQVSLGGTRLLALHDVVDTAISVGDVDADGRNVVVRFNRVIDSSFDSLWRVKSLIAAEWLDTDGSADRITAPSIRVLRTIGDRAAGVLGDFMADLTLVDPAATDAMSAMSVRGWIRGSTVRSIGGVGSIRAAGMDDATVLVGVDPARSAPPTDAAQFTAASAIRSVRVTGFKKNPSPTFINSDIAAFSIGTVGLATVDTSNANHAFGLTAAALGRLTYRDALGAARSFNAAQVPAVGPLDGDFYVRVL